MKNGRDPHWEDPKITSIAAARKKAEAAKKTAGKSGAEASGRSVGELLFGVVIIVMAFGLIVSLTRPIWQAAVSVGN